MQANSHFSLFIVTKNLRKQCINAMMKIKMKNLQIFENQCGANFHTMKILQHLQKKKNMRAEM